jgi:SAM-dependent methyltransferase
MEKWRKFFQTYRIIETKDDEDLLFQVGTTVGGKPISKFQHEAIIKDILNGLNIKNDDVILDLCCGNGIITFDISQIAGKVIGIDGSDSYINNAIKLKNRNNISYCCDDIKNFRKYTNAEKINKVLFYASLAYFSKDELKELLFQLKSVNIEKIFIGSILDKTRKFKYFNTLRRRFHYLYNYLILKNDFGLGNWWSQKEINEIATGQGYKIQIYKQNPILHTAHYRFDALLINDNYDE